MPELRELPRGRARKARRWSPSFHRSGCVNFLRLRYKTRYHNLEVKMILAGGSPMRRIFGISALAAMAVFVYAQVSGSDMLNNSAKALNAAKSVSATFTVRKPSGKVSNYQVEIDLAKPNMARIDSPSQLVVADGTSITTYDKNDNSYYKKPQTADDFNALFTGDEMSLAGPFFNANYYGSIASAKPSGTKNRKGINYDVVT